MTHLKKTALCLGFCLLSIYLTYLIDWYGFTKIGSCTFAFFGKYLMTQLTFLDVNLMRWFPILATIFLLGQKNFKAKTIIKLNLMIFLSLITSLLLGVILALFFWKTGDEISVFLPSYATLQPFANYWTIFISLGIVFPIVLNVLKENKN